MDRTETVQTIAGADANKIADMLASLNGIAKEPWLHVERPTPRRSC